ncbi:hypothetical protein Tco_1159334 [Tanacetum coccineum]
MADKEITIVTKNDSVSTNPLSAVFSKFSQGFNNLQLQFFPPPLGKKEAVKVETERKAVVRGGEVTEVKKTTTVKFPDGGSKSSAATPLKLESEDADRETNPLVLWQFTTAEMDRIDQYYVVGVELSPDVGDDVDKV